MEKIKFKENIKPQYYKRLIRMARKKIYEKYSISKIVSFIKSGEKSQNNRISR